MRRRQDVPATTTIRRFLLQRQGAYCDACLARALGLSLDDVRRHAWRDETGAFTIRYRVCAACGLEKEVIGIRTSA